MPSSMSAADLGPPVVLAVGVALATTLLLAHMRRHAQTTHPLPPSYRGWVPFLGVGLAFLKDVNAFLTKKHAEHPNDGPFRIYVAGQWWSIAYSLPDIKLLIKLKLLKNVLDLL